MLFFIALFGFFLSICVFIFSVIVVLTSPVWMDKLIFVGITAASVAWFKGSQWLWSRQVEKQQHYLENTPEMELAQWQDADKTYRIREDICILNGEHLNCKDLVGVEQEEGVLYLTFHVDRFDGNLVQTLELKHALNFPQDIQQDIDVTVAFLRTCYRL